jgi:hypothetical protein
LIANADLRTSRDADISDTDAGMGIGADSSGPEHGTRSCPQIPQDGSRDADCHGFHRHRSRDADARGFRRDRSWDVGGADSSGMDRGTRMGADSSGMDRGTRMGADSSGTDHGTTGRPRIPLRWITRRGLRGTHEYGRLTTGARIPQTSITRRGWARTSFDYIQIARINGGPWCSKNGTKRPLSVEPIGGGGGRPLRIELCKAHLRVCVDKGLLVDMPDARCLAGRKTGDTHFRTPPWASFPATHAPAPLVALP